MALHTIVEHDSTHIKPYIDAVKETLTNFEESITGEVVDSEPYVLRQGLGNLADMNLVGGSVAWNQLCNGSSVTVPNGHKYYMRKSGTTSIGASTGSAITGLTSGTDNVIDLTQLFGTTTIADYIYGLEQATAGAGVAWFRKYFPNTYYGYQSGKIESVNVASRKVVGKNLVELFFQTKTSNGITFVNNGDGTFTLDGTATTATNIRLDQRADGTVVNPKAYLAGTYAMSKNSTKFGLVIMQESTFISVASLATPYLTGIITVPKYIDNCFIYISINSGASFNNETFKVQIERGNTVTAFEPYKENTFPFDSSKQLRGVPKLVDNKLSYDGDIYTADGTVTRKYGIVDLGSINWAYESTTDHQRFRSTDAMSTAKGSTDNTSLGNIICSKYTTVTASNTYQHIAIGIAISPDKYLYVYDSSAGTDASAFKTAMSGVYLVYELATPTTESATAFQNPQRAFSDGTEEFVDYGVQSAARDVSIPVGNNTTYQLNETLPPTEDYVDGALKFKAAISALGTDESGRTTASRAYTTGEFFYKDGKMYKVLASIASGATFTVGTNCQQTTLFAELKALAQ